MSVPSPSRGRAAQEFQSAAIHAQDMVLAAQAIEARLSSLSIDVPPAVVRETVSLIRAGTGQLALMLLELVARGERLACGLADEGDSSRTEQ